MNQIQPVDQLVDKSNRQDVVHEDLQLGQPVDVSNLLSSCMVEMLFINYQQCQAVSILSDMCSSQFHYINQLTNQIQPVDVSNFLSSCIFEMLSME
jgi:hypothetical protein